MPRALLIVGVLVTAACGYAPPPQTDTQSAAFQTDRAACDGAAAEAVAKRNAKRGLTWFAAPVTRWSQIDDATSACMADKGWGRTRSCTADELRQGSRASGLVVTAAGIRCADPGRAS